MMNVFSLNFTFINDLKEYEDDLFAWCSATLTSFKSRENEGEPSTSHIEEETLKLTVRNTYLCKYIILNIIIHEYQNIYTCIKLNIIS